MRQKVSSGSTTAQTSGASAPLPAAVEPAVDVATIQAAGAEMNVPKAVSPTFNPSSLDALIESVESIRVSWGSEKIQIVKFNVCEIGQLEIVVKPRTGADRTAIMTALYAELEAFGESMRKRKLRSETQAIIESHRALRESGVNVEGMAS